MRDCLDSSAAHRLYLSYWRVSSCALCVAAGCAGQWSSSHCRRDGWCRISGLPQRSPQQTWLRKLLHWGTLPNGGRRVNLEWDPVTLFFRETHAHNENIFFFFKNGWLNTTHQPRELWLVNSSALVYIPFFCFMCPIVCLNCPVCLISCWQHIRMDHVCKCKHFYLFSSEFSRVRFLYAAW